MLRRYSDLYGEDKRLVSISATIAGYHRDNRTVSNYVDASIITQDLQYNLTGIIVNILLGIKSHVVSVSEIEYVIREYNHKEKTKFSFEYFQKIGWLRIINNEVRFPRAVRSHLWRINDKDNQNKPVTPVHLQAEVDCMVSIWNYTRIVKKYSITEGDIKKAISDANSQLDIEYLITNKIIEKCDEEGYEFLANSYTEQLRNRITALLWLRVVEPDAIIENFRRFIRLVRRLYKWPDRLEDHMPYSSLQKLHELSLKLINEEADLLDNSMELTHYILDGSSYHHWEIKTQIPVLPISSSEPFETMREILHHRAYFQDLFDHEESRNDYVLLIRFVIEYDFSHNPYAVVKELMRKHHSLFVKWKLFEEIGRVYPEVIPFFLNDTDLISTAFLCFQKFDVKGDLISTDDHNAAFIQILNIKEEIWMSMFEYVIRQAALSLTPQVYAKPIAEILHVLSCKVFRFSTHNYYNSLAEHKMLKDRYEKVLKIIGSKTKENKNRFPEPTIKPRIMPYLLNGIYESLKSISEFSSTTGFINLENARIDLLTELLRLANTNFSENEIEKPILDTLPELKSSIIKDIYSRIKAFFITSEIAVVNYWTNESEVKVPKRGVSEFGAEIVDWGYIFLFFQEVGLIETLNSEFKNSLRFNVVENKYDSANKEQFEKIRIYLKILMLAYLSINNDKDKVEFLGFEVSITLKQLQGLISYYAVVYSIDDLPNGRVDIFGERNYWFDHNPYYQSLTAMLYRCVNYYATEDATTFFNEFFNKSTEFERIMSALNRIENNGIRKTLIEKIESINIDEFIDSRSTVTELEQAVIETVNSAEHFEFAEPFLKRIEEHIEDRKSSTPEVREFLYKVKMLLALKRNDEAALTSIKIPDEKNTATAQALANILPYYQALRLLEYDKNYDDAISKLEALISNEPKNVQFAFYLYQARVLKYTNDGRATKS